jgi:glucose/arabinose dehydrogenase
MPVSGQNAFFRVPLVRGALAALLVSLVGSPARALTLSTEAAADFEAAVVADSLGNPTDVAVLPDGRFVVIEKGGGVKTYTPGMDDPATDTIALMAGGQNEQGLLGVVADPEFANNQFIYFYASVVQDQKNRHQVRRYKLGADGKLSDMKPVISMGLWGPANHNGGGLTIYGGNLFVGVGDTGKNNGTPHNHIASCLNLANGKVLRVSLAEATLGEPPADNPLTNVPMVTGCEDSAFDDTAPFEMMAPDKRVYAWGFRNPFRLWADPQTGKLWVGDVGEAKEEEVSIVEKGKHYGYPFVEGKKAYTQTEQVFQPDGACMGMTPASECIAPVVSYPTKDPSGSVMGGRILDGCEWPAAWKSRYIYGEHEQGKVWTVDVNATRDGVMENSRKDFADTNGVTAMRLGSDNALYIVELGAGRVTRVTAKGAPATPGSCPTADPAPGQPGGGAGGGGAGGSGGQSAGQNAGGQVAGGNPPGNGGNSPSGGNNPGTSGSSNPGAGTSSTTAGAGGSSGSDDGGCGCRVAGGRGTAALALAGALAIAGVAFNRRRARRSRG